MSSNPRLTNSNQKVRKLSNINEQKLVYNHYSLAESKRL